MGFLFCFHSTIYETNFTPKPRYVKVFSKNKKNELILLYQDKKKLVKIDQFLSPRALTPRTQSKLCQLDRIIERELPLKLTPHSP